MTPFQNEAKITGPTPFTVFTGNGQQSELSPAQIAQWRMQINENLHSTIVLGADFKPMLLNEALRQRLSNPDNMQGTDEPIAFVWETICQTVGRMVAEAAGTQASELAEAFRLHKSCFVAVGTLIRNNSGTYIAAVINIAEINSSASRLVPATPEPAAISAPTELPQEFTDWVSRREQARTKMSKLSRRESQVVALVSNGFPNKSIAHELDISVKTIEKHRANATRKLGVSSTPEMVRIAVTANGDSLFLKKNSDDNDSAAAVLST